MRVQCVCLWVLPSMKVEWKKVLDDICFIISYFLSNSSYQPSGKFVVEIWALLLTCLYGSQFIEVDSNTAMFNTLSFTHFFANFILFLLLLLYDFSFESNNWDVRFVKQLDWKRWIIIQSNSLSNLLVM